MRHRGSQGRTADSIMSITFDYEPREGYLYVRLEGRLSVEAVRGAYTTIAAYCKEHGVRRVLTDTRGLEGSLSTFDIYELGAAVSGMGLTGLERIVVLDRDRPDDHRDFAELVVRNRGVDMRVVIDEEESIRWLLSDGPDDQTGERA